MTKHTPFWMFTIAVFLAPALPRWLSEGMFMDGALYAVIARNLAVGIGGPWAPVLTPTLTPTFFSDHPPLVFWIESLFYRIFGDTFLTEGIYTAVAAVVTAAAMVWLWRRVLRETSALRRLGWLPVLFWAMTPQVTWAYSNNMLECTLSIFTTAACAVLIAGFLSGRRPRAVVWATILIAAGLFAKGPVALFPAAAIAILWVVHRKMSFRAAVAWTAVLLGLVAAVAGAVLLLSEGARANIAAYLDTQFVTSMAGERGSVSNHFGIIFKVFTEVAPALGVCLVLLAVNAFRRFAAVRLSPAFRLGLACLLLGVAGSFPIALSPRQSGFYLVPSFAMYALGFAFLAAPVVSALVERIDMRRAGARAFAAVTAAALAVVLVYSALQFGSLRRNGSLIRDVDAIAAVVPEGATVTICDSMWRDWLVHGVFFRRHYVSLERGGTPREFAVMKGGRCDSVDMERYQPVPIETGSLLLYRLRPDS